MSQRGTVTRVLMACLGSAGQTGLIGADWVGRRAYPWIHLRQKEAHQEECVNEQSEWVSFSVLQRRMDFTNKEAATVLDPLVLLWGGLEFKA